MTTSDSSPASQPLLDLQRLMIAIRRRRRLWLSAAVLGLIAGGVLAFVAPTPPTAVTRLLVLHAEDQPNDSGTLIKTDVALLQTTRIAGAALKTLNSPEPPERFLPTYTGTGLTNNVLELQVTATSYADAVARAQALADAFIADHTERMRVAADTEAQALLNQRDQIQAELTGVDGQIAAAAGRNSQVGPAELQSLYARRADLTSRVSDFTNRASEAKIGSPQLAAGTQIVDAPRPVGTSLIAAAATNGGIGLGFGLVAGLVLAAVMSVVRDRPVLRREISANLGASVIAELPAPRRGPAKLWLRSRYVAERKRVAATLARTVRGDPGTVSVLELACPGAAATLALGMAEELASHGPVAIIDDLPGRTLTGMAGEAEHPIQIVDGSERVPESGGLRIGVGSVSPGTAWTDLGRLGAETVLVVRAGKANTLWLHTVARQLADLRIPVIGVVLISPDPRDRTDGTLWDALHTALRGRSALPATNGSAPRGEDPPTRRFAPVWPVGLDSLETRLNGKLPSDHRAEG